MLEHFRQLPTAVVNLGEAANGREVLRCHAQHVFEMLLRLLVLVQFDERTSESDASGEVGGVPLQSGLAGGDGLFELTRAAVFLGKGGEGDGRRVHLDPAFQFLDARAVGHSNCGRQRLRPGPQSTISADGPY